MRQLVFFLTKNKVFVTGLAVFISLFLIGGVSAQSIRVIPDASEVPSGIPYTSPAAVVAIIFRIVMSVAGAIFLLLLLYGGVTYMVSAGNEDSTSKAKKIMANALIGLVIIVASYSIGIAILRLLGFQGI